MKFISTKAHGILDYLMCTVLIASPWIFGFADGGAAMWVPIIVGASGIIYSLVTDYEYSATKKLSMRAHLWIDMLAGAFLAASPWIFGFSDFVYLPHLILGLAEIGAAICTDPVPTYEHHHDAVHSHRESRA